MRVLLESLLRSFVVTLIALNCATHSLALALALTHPEGCSQFYCVGVNRFLWTPGTIAIFIIELINGERVSSLLSSPVSLSTDSTLLMDRIRMVNSEGCVGGTLGGITGEIIVEICQDLGII